MPSTPIAYDSVAIAAGPDGETQWHKRGLAFLPAILLAVAAQAPLIADSIDDGPPTRRLWLPSLLLLVAAALAAFRAEPVAPRGERKEHGRMLAWGIIATLTAVAILFRSPAVAAAAFMVTILVAAETWAGATGRRAVLPAWLCLWAVVPLPFRGECLLDGVQSCAVEGTSVLLDLTGTMHRVVDDVIRTPGRDFRPTQVGGASFTALAAVVLMAAALGRGPLWSIVLLSTAVVWSFIASVLSVGFAVYAGLQDSSTGGSSGPGWWTGPASVAFVVALVWSTDRWLSWLMPHGGKATARAVSDLLTGGPTEDESPIVRIQDERRVSPRITLVVTLAATAAAACWLVPPFGDGPERAAEASADS